MNLHPSINRDAIDYLIAAGYSHKPGPTPQSAIFSRGIFTVTIARTKIFITEEAPFIPESRAFSFEGLQYLDFFGWAILLQITGAVKLREMIPALGTGSDVCPTCESAPVVKNSTHCMACMMAAYSL
jgi:hypothetical protein